ncbi:MAG: MFS transporter [Proteobacteria bacterium]|nr:MFS transporter [Pseudomonadota bacterium]
MSDAPVITSRVRWLYGFGSIAYGVKDNGFSYFLLFYYNQVLGLPGVYAGTAILIAMVFDAVSDPLVGVWSDNTHSRWGRRHPFMYASALPVAFVYFFLWNPPELSDFYLFIYLTVAAILIRFFITLYEIPSTSMVAELTDDYDERTRLLSFRYMMGWYGGLTMALLMWGVFMVMHGEKSETTYRLYGAVGAVAMLVSILGSSIGLHKYIPYLKAPPERDSYAIGSILRDIKVTVSNRNFGALFFAGLFAAIAGGVSTNFNAYINLHFWEFTPEQVRWIIVGLFGSAALAAVLAPRITQRFDKKRSAMGIYAVGIVFGAMPVLLRLAGLFPDNDSPYLYPIMVCHAMLDVTLIVMFGIVQSSMLADIVEHSEITTGRREEGLFFAARTFASKATSGVGAFLAGVALDLINFPTDAAPGEVPPEVIWDLGFIYGPSLIIFYVLALGSISLYQITRAGHNERVMKLTGANG